MKKIILTGGGTAGHVTPHLALLPYLKNKYEIHYIGSVSGIEKEIISKYPFIKYHTITTVKLIRSLSLKNFLIPFKLFKGISESKKLINKIKPNIIFSKGGFVAVPVVFAASKKNIPIISHESDITIGLANKLILKKCKIMCCSFEKTPNLHGNKCVFTGTPIRNELFNGNKEIALEMCKFRDKSKPTILVMGGSLGAVAINKVIINSMEHLTKLYNIVHIVGKGNLTNTKNNSYHELEFTNEIQHLFALADVVVSRAGSNSINEFLALKLPMLLIPLPKDQSRGDQILNAVEFKKNNFCEVLPQEELNTQTLLTTINSLVKNKTGFIETMNNYNYKNATKEIISLINTNCL